MPLTERTILHQHLDKIAYEETLSVIERTVRHPSKRLLGLSFSKFIYPISHRGFRTKAKTFWGESMNVKLPAGLDIFLTGGKVHSSEIRLAKYFINRVKPGMVFLDVGAHFGYYSRLFMYLCSNRGSCYAFEPSPETFEILNSNRVDKMKIFQNAISDKNGLVNFVANDIDKSEANKVAIEKDLLNTIEVASVSIDEFCEHHNVKPDIIKMDVEGHEAKAVAGAANILRHAKPDVILEIINPSHLQHVLHEPALQLMKFFGYEMYKLNRLGEPEKVLTADAAFTQNLETENILFLPSR